MRDVMGKREREIVCSNCISAIHIAGLVTELQRERKLRRNGKSRLLWQGPLDSHLDSSCAKCQQRTSYDNVLAFERVP